MATEPAVEQVDHLQRSSRDNTSVPDTLARWLTEQDDTPDDTPAVTVAAGGDSNGMSSETIPVSVSWPGEPTRHWVMRMAPSTTDVPVFRSYRMDYQYETMRLIARPRSREAAGLISVTRRVPGVSASEVAKLASAASGPKRTVVRGFTRHSRHASIEVTKMALAPAW